MKAVILKPRFFNIFQFLFEQRFHENCMSLTSGRSPFSKIALMGSSNRLQSECMKNFSFQEK
nr:hypothetical protein Iba_chr11aCG17800 [Ipomoea batatas]GMD57856.1 hypothetical protein Iba_chr11eCG16800 [Ipomoea batatas]